MRVQLLIFFLVFFTSCKYDFDGLRIDKYLNKKGFYSNVQHNKIIKSNVYDQKLNLIVENEYSRVGCNLIDSTRYLYNLKQQIVEEEHYVSIGVKDGSTCQSIFELKDHIKYIYDVKDQFLSKKWLKGSDSNVRGNIDNSNSFYVKDSLSLLKEYLSDLDLIMSNTEQKNIHKRSSGAEKINTYNFDNTPSILMNYGIPINEMLKSLNTYVKDELIVKDEFVFQNYYLTRTYEYKNNLIDRVTIKSVKKADNSKALSTEYFVYVPLAEQK